MAWNYTKLEWEKNQVLPCPIHVDANRRVYLTMSDDTVKCFSIDEEVDQEIWSYPLQNYQVCLALVDLKGHSYFINRKRQSIIKLNIEGKKVWEKDLEEENTLFPVDIDQQGNPFFYTKEGTIYYIKENESQEKVIKININKEIVAKPNLGENNEIVIACDDTHIYFLDFKQLINRALYQIH